MVKDCKITISMNSIDKHVQTGLQKELQPRSGNTKKIK